MTTISITDARARLYKIVDQAAEVDGSIRLGRWPRSGQARGAVLGTALPATPTQIPPRTFGPRFQ